MYIFYWFFYCDCDTSVIGMKIRVLMLITDLELGGAPLYVRQLACVLDPSRFDIHVACLAPQGPVADDLVQNSIPTTCLGAKAPWDLRVLPRLARLIADFKPHILHCSLLHANVTGRIVGAFCQTPHIIATIHTAEQTKPWHLIAENLSCRLSDLTVCVSNSVARHVRRFSHVPAARLRVIPNGIDWQRFSRARPLAPTKSPLNPEKTTLIYIGRLDPIKNIDLLIRAAAHINESHPLQLMIVGDGPERRLLEHLTDKLRIKDCVIFTGFRRDTERCLKSADIFIIPSRTEGMSLATLEAMASGLPVVASRTAGLADMIDHQKTGLLVQPQNLSELQSAIETLITNPTLARKLARNAKKHIKQNFSLAPMINAYSNLYKSIYHP